MLCPKPHITVLKSMWRSILEAPISALRRKILFGHKPGPPCVTRADWLAVWKRGRGQLSERWEVKASMSNKLESAV